MSMNITVKLVSGSSLSVTADASDTVADLKAKIQAQNEVAPENMRLIFKGMVMKDAQTLQSYCKLFSDPRFFSSCLMFTLC